MAESTKDFFDSLPDRANGTHGTDFDASYVFVIDGAGTWTVKVEMRGRNIVHRGVASKVANEDLSTDYADYTDEKIGRCLI